MTEAVNHGARTIEDVVTSAVQEKMDGEYNDKHMVTDWVLIARHIESDGSFSTYAWTSENCDEVIARGLLSVASDDIGQVFGGEDDD
jgi:hypothetical protein